MQITSYKNNLLLKAKVICCESASCNAINIGQNNKCSSIAGAYILPNCEYETTITCRDCVDLTISGCLCLGTGSDSCFNDNWTKYYGNLVNCDVNK
jgi:hypothetical protein